MKKRILITGGTGLLGTHLLLSAPKNVQVYASLHTFKKTLTLPNVSYLNLDVTNKDQVNNIISAVKPHVVIHTAAHSSVDYCEKHPHNAFETNTNSTKYIVDALKKADGKIIFCSTNMTFDGHYPPYSEKSVQHPETVYGKTKVEAEKTISESGVAFTIVRLMTMYGWNWQPERKNMISMAIEKLRKNEQLWMTNDVWNNLLYVEQAAQFFWDITQDEKVSDGQTFHIAGADCTNRYQATMKLCEVFDFDPHLVHEVTSSYFQGQETPRSPNTCFNTQKAEKYMNFTPFEIGRGLLEMKKNPLPKK